MLKEIAGKRILFISARFFNYEKEIQQKLESFGAIVDYFDERPGNDFMTKALIRVNRKLLFKKNDQYYEQIIERTKHHQYDIVFLIKGEVISVKHVKRLRELHPNAMFILYLWDALSYTPNSKNIKPFFDSVYTFDKQDAEIYSDMRLRPLFFIDEYKHLPNCKKDIDALFIGTVHTDRYHILKKIEKQLTENGLNCFFYYYYPNRLLFTLKKIFYPKFQGINQADFHFQGLSKAEVLAYYARAKAIVDIERPKQNGLTMRTIEVFGAKKKLLTTNQSIYEYDLYHPSNIQMIDRDHPVVDVNFFYQGFTELPDDIYQKYSIDYWLYELLCKGVQKEKGNQTLSV
jgi:hypothetical protein